MGRNTLLPDGDVKNGLQEKIFGIKSSKGLLECLSGESSLSDCLQDTDIEKLKIVSAGWKTESADGVVVSSADKILSGISARFDKIFISLPHPNEAVAGEFIKKMDAVILCLSAFDTRRDAAVEAKKRIEAAGKSIGMIVLSHLETGKNQKREG